MMSYECPVCGSSLSGSEERGICTNCKARPRIRTIQKLLDEHLLPELATKLDGSKKALCFAMTSHERTLLAKLFTSIESVSLFGKYGSDHTTGVDARDLSRYPDSAFSTHYSCLLFDYFTEHQAALSEAFRVLSPDGIFITHLEAQRVESGAAAPRVVRTITPKAGYYEYIPQGEGMVSVIVGKEWFLRAMATAGFEAYSFRIKDEASGVECDWFVGRKPGTHLPVANTGRLKPARLPARPLPLLSKEPLQKEYSVPMPPGMPFRHISIILSIPEVTTERNVVRFCEHSLDPDGTPTEKVVAGSIGGYYLSEDLGTSWRRIDVEGLEKVQFVNAFSLPTGSICLQARGLKLNTKQDGQDSAGAVLTVTAEGGVASRSSPTPHQWHGSSSIDYRDGVLMFADYAPNPPKLHGVDQDRCDSGVFRSTDGGTSWTKVFTRSGRDVRHFHTVRCDPFVPGTWYLTSGDLPAEVKVWVSRDDGLSWYEEELTEPTSRFRMTDMLFTEEGIIWGSDDTLGVAQRMDDALPRASRTGARVFFARRDNLKEPIELGYTGQPVRNIVDVGPCWLVITQGSIYSWFTRPRVFLLTKEEPRRFMHLFDVDNHSDSSTGFTFSSCSRKAKDGVFFSVRGKDDVFRNHPSNILKWSIKFT